MNKMSVYYIYIYIYIYTKWNIYIFIYIYIQNEKHDIKCIADILNHHCFKYFWLQLYISSLSSVLFLFLIEQKLQNHQLGAPLNKKHKYLLQASKN